VSLLLFLYLRVKFQKGLDYQNLEVKIWWILLMLKAHNECITET